MEGFVPYLGWAVLTVVVVLIVMHLKKKGVEAALRRDEVAILQFLQDLEAE